MSEEAKIEKWLAGDPDATEELFRRNLPWIRNFVKNKLSSQLRARYESGDIVAEVVHRLLLYAPKCRLSNEDQLRRLLGKIARNVICDHARFDGAEVRDTKKLAILHGEDGSYYDIFVANTKTPSSLVSDREEESRIKLALMALDIDDQLILQARQRLDSWAEVGEVFEISENSARMRHSRAQLRLGKEISRLRDSE